MACFSLISSGEIGGDIGHEAFLILVRRLVISFSPRRTYWMLIPEINLIDDTFSSLSRQRIVIKEHIERLDNGRSWGNIMRELVLHH